MDNRLIKFLSERKVAKGELFTHTTKIKPFGSYYIEEDDLEEFYGIYNQVIYEGGIAGVTEKPEPVVPLIVDIDFRCSNDKGLVRYYKAHHIRTLVGIYQEIIEEIAENPTDKMFYCCVLEKSSPVLNQGRCKDGFHLHFPYFFTEHWVQKDYIRSQAIKRAQERKVFDDIPMLEPIDKVFDKNIPNVTWLMYGSRKDVKSESYTVTKRYNKDMELVPIKTVFKKQIASGGSRKWNLPRYLSIRQGAVPTPLKEDVVVRKSVTRKRRRKKEFQRDLDDILADLVVAEQLLEMLDDERADEYKLWIEVGWILYNISEGHEKGLKLWINFQWPL